MEQKIAYDRGTVEEYTGKNKLFLSHSLPHSQFSHTVCICHNVTKAFLTLCEREVVLEKSFQRIHLWMRIRMNDYNIFHQDSKNKLYFVKNVFDVVVVSFIAISHPLPSYSRLIQPFLPRQVMNASDQNTNIIQLQ